MTDNDKTNERQITEWEQLRQSIAEQERSNSELKRVEKELKDSEEQYKALTENAPIGIYYSDLKGTFLYGNKKAEEIVGYKREELIGKNFLTLKLINQKDIVRATKLLLLNKQGKPTGPDEFVINRKDGTKKLVEINTSIVTLSEKKAVIGMVQDITERKQTKKEIEWLAFFPKLNPMPIVEVNQKSQLTYANPAAQHRFPGPWKKARRTSLPGRA